MAGTSRLPPGIEVMAMNVRSRARSVLPLLAAWLLPLALRSASRQELGPLTRPPRMPRPRIRGGKTRPRSQDRICSRRARRATRPARGRRARSKAATPKKSRRSTGKSAAGSAEKTKKGDADSAKANPGDAAAKASPAAGISFQERRRADPGCQLRGLPQSRSSRTGPGKARPDVLRQADARHAQGESDRAGKAHGSPVQPVEAHSAHRRPIGSRR